MQHSVVTGVRRFIEWLDEGTQAAVTHSAALLRRPVEEWEEWLRENPRALTWHLMDAMLDHAHSTLTRDPELALAATTFVLRHIDSTTVPETPVRASALLRSQAYRERGNALRQTGAYVDALEAYEQSIALLEDEPLVDVEREMARRMAALTRHHLGERANVLEIIREGIAVFEANGLAGEAIRSQMYEGWIAFEERRAAEAYGIFNALLERARSLEDDEIVAQLHNNLGHCAQELGQNEQAIEHLVLALTKFEQQGMLAERPRAIWGLARVLESTGRADLAIAAMKQAASDLMSNGLPIDAALLWLDLLDLLLLAGRHDEVAAHAAQLARTFATARMDAEAIHALSLLQQTDDSIQSTRDRLHALRPVVRS